MNLRVRERPIPGEVTKIIIANIGLTKYALANVYLSRDERRRVYVRARNVSFATRLPDARSFMGSVAVSVASDVHVISILCAIRIRNLLHDVNVMAATQWPGN